MMSEPAFSFVIQLYTLTILTAWHLKREEMERRYPALGVQGVAILVIPCNIAYTCTAVSWNIKWSPQCHFLAGRVPMAGLAFPSWSTCSIEIVCLVHCFLEA